MDARLVVRGAGRRHATIGLSGLRITLGNAPDNIVVLADQTISRRHAIIEFTEGSWVVTDAGSTNGTFVNGQRITGTTPVRDSDELRFGALNFIFRQEGAPDVGAVPTFAGWSSINAGLPLVLLLFAGAAVTSLFVINFSRLESTGLPEIASARPPTVSGTTADAIPSPPSGEDAGPQPWLDALNRYRAMAGLGAVRSDPHLSPGAALHSRYIASNYRDEIRRGVNVGVAMHREDPSKPGFTTEGAAAGSAGDVAEWWDPSGAAEAAWAIDLWMLGPFHRISLLEPHLRNVGYGDSRDAGTRVATLNVHGDLAAIASSPAGPATPVEYPPDGSSIKGADLTAEWPDSLTSCAGYTPPAGLPITLQLGPIVTPLIANYALTLKGDPPTAVEACGIDAGSYANPEAATQTLGRDLLRAYGAIIIVPRKSLAPGRYTMALTASGRDYNWSFTVKP